jgi:hypothetical protein
VEKMIEIPLQTGTRKQESLCAILLGLLIVVCLAADCLLMPVMAVAPVRPLLGFPLLMTSVGCVLAQLCLLAAWLAWSNQPFTQRLRRHWIIAAILYLVWAAGLALGLPGQFTLASSIAGLSMPLVSIAAQLPLWFTRQTFGWRLVREDINNVTDDRPLTIADLMLATVLFALALAAACRIPSPDGKEMKTPLFLLSVATSTVSTITMVPASLLILGTKRFQYGVLGACLYTALWMSFPWVIVLIARYRGLFASPPVAVLIGLSSLVLSFSATAILAATAARALGYRLAMGRRPHDSSSERRLSERRVSNSGGPL